VAEPTPRAEQSPRAALEVITTVTAYEDAVSRIAAGSGPVAVDAERASGFKYSQRAYLIQVFRREAGTFLFDPPALLTDGLDDLSALGAAMAHVEWVLHAASQDLACLREVGLDPEAIFDTELGARLAGLPRVGLGAVAEELLGIHLAKEHSAADWSTRPLPQSWLVYAALDVELLPDLRDKIGALLDENGKTEFARQEFSAVLERETISRQEPWRRLSGMHTLKSTRQLAAARALWIARDDYAREIDTAPGRLVPDTSLVVAARALPASKKDLAAIKEFTGRASRGQLDRWFTAIQAGVADPNPPALRVPSEGPPPPRLWVDRNPEADRRLKAARVAVGEKAVELDLPVENLLTPESLRRLAWNPPDEVTAETVDADLESLGARQWQRENTAQLIATAFIESGFVEADQTLSDTPPPAS
jgi:ribonuclease D